MLRARYKKAPADLLAFFQALLGTDDTVIEAAEEVRNALDWQGHGSAVMHTFDRDFCKAALAAGIAPEVRIWEA